MKYIFFDIDGTLLDPSKGILNSTVEALEKAKANGHKIFINTGRSLAEVGSSFDRFNFDGLVCAAGSYIKLGDEIIFNKVIEEDELNKIVEILDELNIHFGLEGEKYTYFTEPVYQGYRQRIYKAIEGILDYELNGFEPYHYMIQPSNVRRYDDYVKDPTPINKLLIYSNDIEHNKKLSELLPDDYFLIIYDTFAELINRGLNKATGIDKVMSYYGADIKDSIAIGDSLNDLDMLAEAGIGIAMGNANDIVKSHADVVAPHILDDGLYKVLDDLDII